MELSQDLLTKYLPFTVIDVFCEPRTLFLGVKLSNPEGAKLSLEFNNYWIIYSDLFKYSWTDNLKCKIINYDFSQSLLVGLSGYSNLYDGTFEFNNSLKISHITTDNSYPESTWGATLTLTTGEQYFAGEINPEMQRLALHQPEKISYKNISYLDNWESFQVDEEVIRKVETYKTNDAYLESTGLKIYTQGNSPKIDLQAGAWSYRSSTTVTGCEEPIEQINEAISYLHNLRIKGDYTISDSVRIIRFDDSSEIIQIF